MSNCKWKSNMIIIKWVTFLVVCSFVFGAYVPEVVAKEVARNIYIEHENLHGGDDFLISQTEIINEKGNKLIYIFHLIPKGFIMVPADDQAVPNLAFGFEHSFESNNMPFNLNSLMSQYKTELQTMVNIQNVPESKIKELYSL